MKRQENKPPLESVRSAWKEAVEQTPCVSTAVIGRALARARDSESEESLAVLDVFWGVGMSVALSLLISVSYRSNAIQSSSEDDLESALSTDPIEEVFRG